MFAQSATKKVLIIPSMPTPNGRLHLGHMAGPYLRSDFLARHYRRLGHLCSVISGVDAFESFVLLAAHQEQRTPSATVEHYTLKILDDLHSLSVFPNEWINPLQSPWREPFSEKQLEMFRRLETMSLTDRTTEQLLFSPSAGRFVIGCWLIGTCPVCASAAGSFSCENCGAHFNPQDLMTPIDRLGAVDLETRVTESAFLKGTDWGKVEQAIRTKSLADSLRFKLLQKVTGQIPTIRLTIPGEWGVPVKTVQSQASVLFSYSFNFAYCLHCGDQAREHLNEELNPFNAESSVTTIATFGIDVLSTKVINSTAIATALGLRTFDRWSVNHFYLLEGKKFSTSRRHAIWAADLVRHAKVQSDAVRTFCALTSPTFQPMDFVISDFVRYTNEELYGRLNTVLRRAASALRTETPSTSVSTVIERCAEALEEQSRCFDTEPFDPQSALQSLIQFILFFEENVVFDHDFSYWWLKSFAFLCEPFMPSLAQNLWSMLGHADAKLELQSFLYHTIPTAGFEDKVAYFQSVKESAVRTVVCNPQTLS